MKKTVARFSEAEHFPESRPRSVRGRKLSRYLPYVHAQGAGGEHNIAHLSQAIRDEGLSSEDRQLLDLVLQAHAQLHSS